MDNFRKESSTAMIFDDCPSDDEGTSSERKLSAGNSYVTRRPTPPMAIETPIGSPSRWRDVLQMVFHAMHVNGFLRGGSGGGGGNVTTDFGVGHSTHFEQMTNGSEIMCGGGGDHATIANANRLQREPFLKRDMMDDDHNHEQELNCDGQANCWQVGVGANNKDAMEVQSCDADKECKDFRSNDDDDDDVVKINLTTSIRAETKFPKEKLKTLVAFSFAFCAAMTNSLTLAIVHERLPDREKSLPLPDVVFDLFTERDWAMDVSEALLVVSLTVMFLVTFLHKHRFIVLRRSFLIFGILYVMRAISMLVTQVPVSSSTIYCAPRANSTNPIVIVKRVIELTSGLGMSINGHQNYCGDYIYSGHTVSLTLCYLMIREYTPRRCVLLYWMSWAASVTGVFLVLVAHAHYTIDILLAYYVTTRVFYIYHTMANNMDMKTPGSTNYLARVWWFCIFDYFERNVRDRVPMQYEWPSSWPWRKSFYKGDRNS